MKHRTGPTWIPAPAYGAMLPAFTVNLIVREIERAVAFYRDVLLAHVHYADPDFAAVRVMGVELMLHADHTYDQNPWAGALASGAPRGLGAELRLLGMNPDDLAARARRQGAGPRCHDARPWLARGDGARSRRLCLGGRRNCARAIGRALIPPRT